MNKAALIERLASEAKVSKKQSMDMLEALVNIIISELKAGNEVTITGFGTFKLSHRAARTGVNPRNPTQKIQIPAMKVPSFKAGKTLKDAVR